MKCVDLDDGELNEAEIETLERHGLPVAELARQLDLLRSRRPRLKVLRPCTVDDGIEVLEAETHGRLLRFWDAAARAGRLSKWVPASGSATRMFRSLEAVRPESGRVTRGELEARAAAGDIDAESTLRFVDALPELPFAEVLAEVAGARGLSAEALLTGDDIGTILALLLDDESAGFSNLAKALIPFHRYASHAVTAAEEHVAEGLELVSDATGGCRLHFTVPEGSEKRFRETLAAAPSGVEIELSNQAPSTDTVALDSQQRPFRDASGRVLVRAGGHGALLGNLEHSGGDLVLIKNIDNVRPVSTNAESVHWQRLLIGRLHEIEGRIHDLLSRLDRGETSAIPEAERFVAATFGAPIPVDGDRSRWLIERLDRPLRVCGMVVNRGEPGGGPFWVADAAGSASKQIVETAEIDGEMPPGATHFNPVLMAVAIRDREGRTRALSSWIDSERYFVSRKSHAGSTLLALERPGLWNGAMAHWNTVFVEVPEAVFTPVKTVLDLLRPEHRST